MIVLSVSGLRKKMRMTTKVLMVGLILFLLVYLINFTYTSLNETIIVTEDITAEDPIIEDGKEHHYPGEPIRVTNNLDDYWQTRIDEIANQ